MDEQKLKIKIKILLISAVSTVLSFLLLVNYDFFTLRAEQHYKRNNSSMNDQIVNLPPFSHNKVKPTVNLAVVVCGERLKEAVTHLKSAIIFGRDVNLNIIAFADGATKLSLPKELEKLSQSAAKLGVEFKYSIHKSWFPATDTEYWKKSFRLCATQRLFFPSLLPHVDSLLYLDSDTIFLSNVLHLWDKFSEMHRNNGTIAAMVAEHELPGDGWYNVHARAPYYGPRGLNSGVMLMNLTKFRQLNVEKTILNIHNKFKNQTDWADQGLLNVFFHDFPSLVYELSCDFNYRVHHCECEYDGDCSCKSANSHGISIIHGNSKRFHSIYPKDKFANYIFNAFKRYNLEADTPHQLYQTLEQEHENLQNNKKDGGSCAKLMFKDMFKKFKNYLYSA